jgi:nitrogen-specific signal transduction histidine kinase
MLVEDSPAMICRYTPDLTLTFGNTPTGQLPGMRARAVTGDQPQRLVVAGRTAQRLCNASANLSPEFPVSTAEISLQLPGREHAWWVWSDRGVFDEHGAVGQKCRPSGRDNTEVRRSQQQLTQSAKMATLGEMATGLAHEINQPLNVMRMAIANVLKRLSNGDVQTRLPARTNSSASMHRCSARRRVVDHMRVFGRRSEVEQQVFDPAHCGRRHAVTAQRRPARQRRGDALRRAWTASRAASTGPCGPTGTGADQPAGQRPRCACSAQREKDH